VTEVRAALADRHGGGVLHEDRDDDVLAEKTAPRFDERLGRPRRLVAARRSVLGVW
jgi:hypothetical protein